MVRKALPVFFFLVALLFVPVSWALGTTQNVAYTGTAGTIANKVGTNTRTAWVMCSTDCHIATGANPTATTSDMRLPANVLICLQVSKNLDKISAIQVTDAGTLYVTETDC